MADENSTLEAVSESAGPVGTETVNETGKAPGDAAEPEVVDAKMNKLNSMVLIIMVALFVAAIATLVIIPPNGSQPVSSASEAQFEIAQKTTLLTPGFAPATALRYFEMERLDEPLVYSLFIQEENRYESKGDVRTEFTAKVVVERGNAEKSAQSVYVSLKDVTLTVLDGGKDRGIRDVGSMLSDIILEGRLDPVHGMSRLVPLVKINPHSRHVLYIVLDVVRAAYMGLPEGKVGHGGLWENVVRNAEGDKHAVVMTANKKGASLYEIHLNERYDGLERGRGTATWMFESGVVSEFKGQIRSELSAEGQGHAPHSLSFSLVRSGSAGKAE